MRALQTFVEGTIDPSSIETHAAFKALQFTHHMGFTTIILEGDALTVINKIKQPSPSLLSIGILIRM